MSKSTFGLKRQHPERSNNAVPTDVRDDTTRTCARQCQPLTKFFTKTLTECVFAYAPPCDSTDSSRLPLMCLVLGLREAAQDDADADATDAILKLINTCTRIESGYTTHRRSRVLIVCIGMIL